SGLYAVKPDSRVFGFNHPNPTREQPIYGYEYWVTIPEDMEVPAPGVKKRMDGGLYAAHCMEFPNFHEWQWLNDWAENNGEWEGCFQGPEVMFGLLEEHLNWVYAIAHDCMDNGTTRKLDLLLPIRKK
ncbi:MAG: effector binding domain-containing protein, partial [Clostridia bacterium]|nr:effector binding domain-containing protein [Clostridia bacterium]